MIKVILVLLAAAVISYLLGSISFAIIYTEKFAHKDVRKYGSGNAGMTNVIRTSGKKLGIITFLCDILKAVIACLIGRLLLYPIAENEMPAFISVAALSLFCGVFCQLGHIFPVYFGFKGGKGVAVCVGIMIISDWKATLISCAIFLVLFLVTKIVSLGSIIAAFSLPFAVWVFADTSKQSAIAEIVIAGVLGLVIILKHKDNIVRLIKGEEKKITAKEG